MKASPSSPSSLQKHRVRTAAFTIISCNYAAQASVLFDSLAKFHPAWERFLLLVDRPKESFSFPTTLARTLPIQSLMAPSNIFWLSSQPQMVACTAAKPFGFHELLRQGFSRVIYFDPDICLYSRLPELERALGKSSLVLTPHVTSLLEEEHFAFERLAPYGMFNLGFLAIKESSETLRFLEWWKNKCLTASHANPLLGSYTDQRFFDLVPSLTTSVTILRNPGYNIAYWNAHGRPMAPRFGKSFSPKSPHSKFSGKVRFIHFSGCPKQGTQILSRFDARPCPPWIRPYLRAYQGRLHKAAARFSRVAPYQLTLESLLGISKDEGAQIRLFPNLQRSLEKSANPEAHLRAVLSFMRLYQTPSRITKTPPSRSPLTRQGSPKPSTVTHVFYCSDTATESEARQLKTLTTQLRKSRALAQLMDLSLSEFQPGLPLTKPDLCIMLPSCFAISTLMNWWFLFQGSIPRIAIGSHALPTFTASLVDAVVRLQRKNSLTPALLRRKALRRARLVSLRAVIAGAGSAGQSLALRLPPLFKLIAFSDQSPQIRLTHRGGIPIVAPQQIAALKPDIVLIASAFHREIRSALNDISALKGRILIYDSLGMTRPI